MSTAGSATAGPGVGFILKILNLSGALALAATMLAGCQDPTGVTTVPAKAAPAVDRTATLSWQAPATNTNGAALTDLAGFRIYYGTDSADLAQTVNINSVGIETYEFDNLNAGTWYFALKAVTSAGVESALSQIVSKTIT